MKKIFIFLCFCLNLFMLSNTSFAFDKDLKRHSKSFEDEQLKFNFIASDGSFWLDCSHKKTELPNDWLVSCKNQEFKVHTFLYQYPKTDETTYEIHFWADETKSIHETHTQSTWLSIDKTAKAKKIVSYIGFQNDATQLRIEIATK